MAQNQNDILDMFWRLQCLKDSLLIKGIASILRIYQCTVYIEYNMFIFHMFYLLVK